MKIQTETKHLLKLIQLSREYSAALKTSDTKEIVKAQYTLESYESVLKRMNSLLIH